MATVEAGLFGQPQANQTAPTTPAAPITGSLATINNIYRNVFGQDAGSPAAVNSWATTLDSGKYTGEQVYADMLSEAKKHGAPIKNMSFADASKAPTGWVSPNSGTYADEFFRNTMSREPTAAELAKYGTGDIASDWDRFYSDFGTTNGFKPMGAFAAAQLTAPNQGGLLTTPKVNTTNSGTPITTTAPMIDPSQVNNAYTSAMSGVKPLSANAPQVNLTGLSQPGANAVDIRNLPTVTAQTAKGSYAPDKAQTYTADKVKLTNDMLVNNQLNKIIAADNPLMQSARTSALQSMNGRGLLNSSMSAEAAQKAVIDSALPIAQQDANTHRGLAEFNTTAENKAREFAANAQNTRDIENAKLRTEVELQNVRNNLDASIANQDTQTKVALQNSANALQAQLAIYDAEIKVRTTNAALQSDQDRTRYNAEMNMAGNQASSLVSIMQGNQSATSAFNNLNSQQQFALQQNYNQSVTLAQNWAQTEIARIMNSDATEEQKSAAFENIQIMRDSSLGMTNALYQSSPQWSSTFATLDLPTYTNG